MRSKEVEKAIDFVKFYKEHCLNIENSNIENYETINDEEFIYKNLDTVLNYISEKEKENKFLRDENNIYKNETVSKSVIRDKIKELEEERKEIESSPYDKWDLYKVIGKIQVLKEILGESIWK